MIQNLIFTIYLLQKAQWHWLILVLVNIFLNWYSSAAAWIDLPQWNYLSYMEQAVHQHTNKKLA